MTASLKHIRGKVAAITGAASGLGRALAVMLANEGCNIAISDVDEHNLNKTAELAAPAGMKVTTHLVDVSVRERVYQYAKDVVDQHGGVHIIINNAGVLLCDSIEDISYENMEWLMNINFWGAVYGSKAFLPYLKQQPEGHIVNISSAFGFFTKPFVSAYCASKFAVRGFTETLIQEMRATRIKVSCAYPGGLKTGLVRNARYIKSESAHLTRDERVAEFHHFCVTTPESAAKTIIKGIKKNRNRILIGPDARLFDLLTRTIPVIHTKIWAYLARVKHK